MRLLHREASPAPAAPSGIERRAEPRFRVSEAVTVTGLIAGQIVVTVGRSVDLSRSGGRLDVDNRDSLAGSDVVAVVFDEWPLAVLARLINISERGLHLAFQQMPEDQKSALAVILARGEPA